PLLYGAPPGRPGSVRHEGHPLYTGLRCVPLPVPGGLRPGGDLRPAALRRDPAPKCLRYLRHAGAGLLRLQLRRGPQAGLHAIRPAGEGPPGRGPDGAAGRRRVCPCRQRRRPHQRFFQRAGGNRRQTVSGLKERETARGDACPCGRSSI
ncbi:CBS domain-containing protein, partial [Dysosmobacter welbionis]